MKEFFQIPRGGVVAVFALASLCVIVGLAISELPAGEARAEQIVAIATAAFGVIGAVVGAYFGVTASNAAQAARHEESQERQALLASVQRQAHENR